VSQKKLCHFYFFCNFGKCWSIFKILSMSESERGILPSCEALKLIMFMFLPTILPNIWCFVVDRPPRKVQSVSSSGPRKSLSKCLEAMFEATEMAAAAIIQSQVAETKSCEVESKQMSSTPIDHNANKLHHPPVSSFIIMCCWVVYWNGYFSVKNLFLQR